MSILSGHLLIASPYLADRNFFRSVVLIVSHDAEHASGLLLNRPGYDPVARVWEEMTGNSYEREETVRTAGHWMVHSWCSTKFASFRIRRLSPTFTCRRCLTRWKRSFPQRRSPSFQSLVTLDGVPANWRANLEVGGWMTLPATADIIFTAPSEQWSVASRHVSDSILSGVDLRHVPQDPRWN